MSVFDKNAKEHQAATAEPTSDSASRKYHTPVFVHHGSAADIVRANAGIGGDGGSFPSDTLS